MELLDSNPRAIGEGASASPAVFSCIGGTVHHYSWNAPQLIPDPLVVTYEVLGDGEPILLLPAFSTVSSRAELHDLAQALASSYQVTAIDWPGFGDSARPRAAYGPDLYCQFLSDFLQAQWSHPIAVVAAGHAAGYVMALTPKSLWSRITLVAPTWRGPLTVMGAPPAMRKGVKNLVRSPLLGQFLYYLNTRPSFLKWMYERHVVVDADILTPDYIQQRYTSTQQPGARYAPAAFVTGGLDPVANADQLLQLVKDATVPVTVIVSTQAPSGSKADMEAIAALPNVQRLAFEGSLGMAEELGSQIGAAILSK